MGAGLPVVTGTTGSTVLQALHLPHLPTHWGVVHPHSRHRWSLTVFAMPVTLRVASDSLRSRARDDGPRGAVSVSCCGLGRPSRVVALSMANQSEVEMRSPLTWMALAGLPLLLLGVGFIGQRWLIYFPDRRDPGSATRHFVNGRDVIIPTADGLELHAWMVGPSGRPRDAAVLYAPGNGGNRLDRVSVAQGLADAGFSVLLLEYRGYGSNPGKPSEPGLIEDARAAIEFLGRQGFEPERTLYVGESLGTGVVTALAIEQPPAGLVLRSPYTSLGDMAEKASGGLPVGGLVRDRFDTLSRIPEVETPTVVLSGDADLLVPASQSASVAAAAGNLHREVVLEGVGHNHEGWFGADLVGPVCDLADDLGL